MWRARLCREGFLLRLPSAAGRRRGRAHITSSVSGRLRVYKPLGLGGLFCRESQLAQGPCLPLCLGLQSWPLVSQTWCWVPSLDEQKGAARSSPCAQCSWGPRAAALDMGSAV